MRRFAWFGLCLAALALPLAAWGQSKPTTPPGGQKPPSTQPMLTSSEIQGLKGRIAGCWTVPKSMYLSNVVVTVQVKFAKDGSLAEPPRVVNSSPDPLFAVAAKSAIAALTKCAPFSSLPPAKYEVWKEIMIDFDPSVMVGDKPH